MQRLDPRVAILLIALPWIEGCGGAKSPPPAPTPPQTVVAAPPAPTAPNTTKPKSSTNGGGAKSALLANADPKTVFVVTHDGEPMEVEATGGIRPSDQFAVVAAESGGSSTNFVIESANPSAQSQSLTGTGKPKAGFTLPKGFTAVKEWGYSPEGLPMRIMCEKSGSTLAVVPGGISIVGTDTGPEECTPSFKVRLDTFYMSIVEVTVEEYERYRTEMREKKKPLPVAAANATSPPTTPVLGISLSGAQNFARWAAMELPTEAEIEKAARGPTGLRTPWGDGKPLWTDRKLTTTGAYSADRSPYGIFDLAGNAKEWCSDHYSPTSHKDAATASAKEMLHNWPGPKNVRDMNLRVVKGNGPDWSSWYREGKDAGKSYPDVGFRCVLRISAD